MRRPNPYFIEISMGFALCFWLRGLVTAAGAKQGVSTEFGHRNAVAEAPMSNGEKTIETTIEQAARRQIHLAIAFLHRAEYEAAITLAAAAEGMLPDPGKPYLFPKLKAWAERFPKEEPGAKGLNDFSVWLKHGEAKGDKYAKAAIPEIEVVTMITRAISKYLAVYEGISPEMAKFRDGAIKRLQEREKS
jgi:hypothetical protein